MKTERSKAGRAAAKRKDDGERTESRREKDPDAFERLMKRGRKTTKDEGEPKNKAARPRGDIGDEESWRGRVVEGEAQLDKRETRRGRVEHTRAQETKVDSGSKRERRRDDIQAGDVKERRQKDRAETGGRGLDAPHNRREPDTKAAGRGSAQTDPSPPAAEANAEPGKPVTDVGATTSRASAASEETRSRQSEVAQIAEKIVESARAGFDAEGRKFMTMTLDVPGRGRLEIRLRKHGSKMQVELAADSPAFGRLLRRSRKDLKQQTRQRGVQLSSVRVTR